jgi:hypothetical protein
MRRFLLLTSVGLAVSFAVTADASPTTIGVFFDAAATDCDTIVAPLSAFNVYVSAVLGTDAAASGITAAAFRVDGLAGIVSSVTPNPAAPWVIGNPTTQGCLIAFPSCMTGSGPRSTVPLYTITCSVGETASPRTLTVSYVLDVFGDPPWLPYVDLCDDPNYTRLYVSGGQAFINNGSCTVALQPRAWSSMKSLFR